MLRIVLLTTSFWAVWFVSCQRVNPPPFQEVAHAKIYIEQLIRAHRTGRNDYFFIAGFVRLSFHDCVGKEKGNCDGCIDHSNPSNKGLKEYTNELNKAYEFYKDVMSRADFYALAAVTALEMSTTIPKKETTKFDGSRLLFGREDCGTSPDEAGPDDVPEIFPKSLGNYAETFDFFLKQFGFNERETTALLGAHTLGRARIENSGFKGEWRKGNGCSSTLNSKFYKMVLRPDLVQDSVDSSKLQWMKKGDKNPALLLNSDMVLAWNIDPNPKYNGRVSCVISKECRHKMQRGRNPPPPPPEACCTESKANKFTKEYAKDDDIWRKDFENVFFKMLDHGHTGLKPLVTEGKSLPSVSVTEPTVKTERKREKTMKAKKADEQSEADIKRVINAKRLLNEIQDEIEEIKKKVY